MTAPITGDVAVVRPFKGRLKVTQGPGAKSFWLLILFSMLCSVPFIAVAPWIFDDNATGWRGFLGFIGMLAWVVLFVVGMLASFVGWFLIEDGWRRIRRMPEPFSASTNVTLNESGFAVEGLGSMPWSEVLALEGIPDSESSFIVRTQRFGGLILNASVDDLMPVFQNYMDQLIQTECQKAIQADGDEYTFKALVFRWGLFAVWIVAGYATAIAVGSSILVESNRGLLPTILGALLLSLICAWLIWAIPFAQLTSFSSSRVRGFRLQADHLASQDGLWTADLRTSRIWHRHKSGIGYDLKFMSIRPASGRQMDLVLSDADMNALIETLRMRHVIVDGFPEGFP
jgi:hypothetical protein